MINRLLALVMLLCCASAYATEYMFSPVEARLTDNRVRGILQLPDRRMLFATESGLEIYDGAGSVSLPYPSTAPYRLEGYDGHLHLYLDGCEPRLWVKNRNSLRCLDLVRNRYVENVDSLFTAMGYDGVVDDVFVDSMPWIVSGDSIIQPVTRFSCPRDKAEGEILDMLSSGGNLYIFYRSGIMSCISLGTGKEKYRRAAFGPEDYGKFSATSLVVPGPGGFYQLRNGSKGGFFKFDMASREWTRMLETDFYLNTLAIDYDGTAYISCPKGIIEMNVNDGAHRHIPSLRTRKGNVLATEISTVYCDVDGALWLGTVNRGLLYHHPRAYRHLFIPASRLPEVPGAYSAPQVFSEDRHGNMYFSGHSISIDSTATLSAVVTATEPAGEYGSGGAFIASDGSLYFHDRDGCHIFIPRDADDGGHLPVISGLLVNGESYDGAGGVTPPYLEEVSLPHDRNFVTIECASVSYASDTGYRYRLRGIDDKWISVESGDLPPGGALRAVYTSLPPGSYQFEVATGEGDDAPVRKLGITIRPPWWLTVPALILWGVLAVAIIVVAVRVYSLRTRRELERKHREEILLTRIRSLIEQCDRYEAERNVADEPQAEENPEMSPADAGFIARAVELVERNLDTPGYSVEQLSRDLCMERTGLYRKLTALLDRSPSLFMRDIRLRHVARLVKEGRLSMAEIAEKTGFSSSSYMSRCFQEVYGCRPGEYATKNGV